MNPLQHPVLSLVVFIAFVVFIAVLIGRRQKRMEADSTKQFAPAVSVRQHSTPEEPAKPLSRRERRAEQFGTQSVEQIDERMRVIQRTSFKELSSKMEHILLVSNLSFNNAVTELIRLCDREITAYRNRARNRELESLFISAVDIYVTQTLIKAIVFYAHRCKVTEYSSISLDLTKYLEETMRIRGLTGVLYRNKGTHSNSQRYSAMFKSIEEFFKLWPTAGDEVAIVNTPFDQLKKSDFIDNDSFRREFYSDAIDGTFYEQLQIHSRESIAKKDRERNAQHEHNRKQRNRRVQAKKRN